MLKLLLFIPCYCCENQIGRVIQKIKLSGLEADILLIDNRSPDQTIIKAQQALIDSRIQNATILKNKLYVSLGGSHKVAFKYAVENNYTHLIVLHGDDQADIRDLIPLLKEKIYLDYDCLLGSRFMPSSKLIGYSAFRIFGNRILNQFCNLVCRNNISDMGSGLNFYNVRFMRDSRFMELPDDLTFNVFLLFHSYHAGFKTLFFPISWREEDQISNAKVFSQMKKILKGILEILKDPSRLYEKHSRSYAYEVVYKK